MKNMIEKYMRECYTTEELRELGAILNNIIESWRNSFIKEFLNLDNKNPLNNESFPYNPITEMVLLYDPKNLTEQEIICSVDTYKLIESMNLKEDLANTYKSFINNYLISEVFDFSIKTETDIRNHFLSKIHNLKYKNLSKDNRTAIFVSMEEFSNNWVFSSYFVYEKCYFFNKNMTFVKLESWDEILKFIGVEYTLKRLLNFSNTLYEKNEIDDKTGYIVILPKKGSSLERFKEFISTAPDFIKLYIEST